jgi:ribosome biogenesis GTPase / thiamine phosphate phosphatase
MEMKNLGYNDFFESNRKKLNLGDFSVGRIIAENRGSYKIKTEKGGYLGKITGKQIFNASSRADYPAVGDWVAITIPDSEHAVIHQILPRQTIIQRKYINKSDTQIIATNIDVAFIVESIDRDYSLNRLERYFAVATDSNIKPAVILNKTDLIPQEELNEKLKEIKDRFSETDIISTSVINNNGLDELRKYIEKGKTYCFLGSSGVGKSSLINKLLEKDFIKTGDISSYSHRGKHITTSREMYFLENGGIVIDNPGMREVGMADTDAGIDSLFDEITALAKDCKYADCTHVHEPGCAVLLALKSGKINEKQYQNFINLKKEVEYYKMTKLEKREKDKQFGKFIKNTKEDLKKYKNNY